MLGWAQPSRNKFVRLTPTGDPFGHANIFWMPHAHCSIRLSPTGDPNHLANAFWMHYSIVQISPTDYPFTLCKIETRREKMHFTLSLSSYA
jgi:hypothetical protein